MAKSRLSKTRDFGAASVASLLFVTSSERFTCPQRRGDCAVVKVIQLTPDGHTLRQSRDGYISLIDPQYNVPLFGRRLWRSAPISLR